MPILVLAKTHDLYKDGIGLKNLMVCEKFNLKSIRQKHCFFLEVFLIYFMQL